MTHRQLCNVRHPRSALLAVGLAAGFCSTLLFIIGMLQIGAVVDPSTSTPAATVWAGLIGLFFCAGVAIFIHYSSLDAWDKVKTIKVFCISTIILGFVATVFEFSVRHTEVLGGLGCLLWICQAAVLLATLRLRSKQDVSNVIVNPESSPGVPRLPPKKCAIVGMSFFVVGGVLAIIFTLQSIAHVGYRNTPLVQVNRNLTNSNACLVHLGQVNTQCLQNGNFRFTWKCCEAVGLMNEMGCFCNPVFPVIVGKENWGFIQNQLLQVCGLAAGFIPTIWQYNYGANGIDCSPFEAHTYHGGVCAKSDSELDAERMHNFLGFTTALQTAYATPGCFNVSHFENSLKPFLNASFDVMVGMGIGTYTGLRNSVEYLAIFHPTLNREWGRATIGDASTDPSALLHFDTGKISAGTSIGFDMFRNVSAYCFQSLKEYYFEQTGLFSGCHTLLSGFEVPGNSVSGRFTDLWVVGEISFWTTQNSTRWGREAICGAHEQFCTGPLRQFVSKAECIRFMQEIPVYSPICGAGGILGGNSSSCRFKHHFMLPLAPENHCPHIGYGHTPDPHGHFKCNDASECYAGNRAISSISPKINIQNMPTSYAHCLTSSAEGYHIPDVCG